MRNSGILMHITSLPGANGIGTMGKRAFEFVDFLERAGQHSWQILPLTPTGYGDSPYQSCSAYAGNHYLIDLDQLCKEGLLKKADYEDIVWCDKETKVNFGYQYNNKLTVLRKAYANFPGGTDFDIFAAENAPWLRDYALFMALKDRYNGKPWYEWEDGLKFREEDALENAFGELADPIRFYSFVQYIFYRQWSALLDYAHKKDVRVIGDVPIYVPLDSVEVWSDPQLFQLDEDLKPTAVAGCPPDAFSADGQLWGNPLYRWDVMEKQNFKWWTDRLGAAGERYDLIRLDHFRGFEAYWSVPYGDKTARNGKWITGPGMAFIEALKRDLPDVAFIAEDLGFLTQEVLDLRDNSGYPGMKVLQFAFDGETVSEYQPHTYIPNTVCYTGTHDNMTMQHWFDTADKVSVDHAAAYMGLNQKEGFVWGAIRSAMSSVSDLCVVQMQDYLGLGAQGRMNFPGTMTDANWTWRAEEGYDSDALAEKIRALTKLYGRLGKEKKPELKKEEKQKVSAAQAV